MTDMPDNARMEIKFVTSSGRFQETLLWLRLHHACFRQAFPDRWVNNIYFDSPDLNSYTSNLSGESARSKLRLRWYGDMEKPENGTLELKCKRNLFNWKRTYDVPCLSGLFSSNWRSSIESIKETLPDHGQELLSSRPKPILINRYYRHYLISQDNRIRITVDGKMAAWDQQARTRANLKSKALLANMIVVEAKFNQRDRDLAVEYLGTIPARSSRHSKYINSVNAIKGLGIWL